MITGTKSRDCSTELREREVQQGDEWIGKVTECQTMQCFKNK